MLCLDRFDPCIIFAVSSPSSSSDRLVPCSVLDAMKSWQAAMEEAKKWKLTTGTVVEDKMVEFALACKYEQYVCGAAYISFILFF